MIDSKVVDVFKTCLKDDVALPVAAMISLVSVIRSSTATTWMGLERDLSTSIQSLKSLPESDLGGRTPLSLASGCEIFMKNVSRIFSHLESMVCICLLSVSYPVTSTTPVSHFIEVTSNTTQDFATCKIEMLKRGELFPTISSAARAKVSSSFIFLLFINVMSDRAAGPLLRP
jgi:hypothetical protein